MLSNAYCLANVRFDTAENEPAKNLQNILKKIGKNWTAEGGRPGTWRVPRNVPAAQLEAAGDKGAAGGSEVSVEG